MLPSALNILATPEAERESLLSGWVRAQLAEFLQFDDVDEIAEAARFADLGTDSSQAIEFKLRMEDMFSCQLRTTVLFEYPTVDRFVRKLLETIKGSTSVSEEDLPQVKSLPLHSPSPTMIDRGVKPATGMRYPLSETQRGLWYISETLRQSTSFNVPLLFRLRDPVDPGRLNTALREVLRRHPALRCRLANIEVGHADINSVAQEILPESLFEGALPLRQEGAASVRESMLRELRTPFDLYQGMPLRCFYGTEPEVTNGREHFVLMIVHHLVIDGLSAIPMTKELWQIYQELSSTGCSQTHLDARLLSGEQDSEEQFFQFIDWEQQYLQSDQYLRDLTYWKSTLADVPTQVELPCRVRRQTDSASRGTGCVRHQLPSQTLASLQRLATELQVPPSAIFLTLFYVFLWRVSGESDLAVTTPVAGRPSHLKSGIGCFINLIVSRCRMVPEQPVSELLTHVRDVFMQGIEHGHFPYARLVPELRLSLGDSRHRVFPVSFTYQNIFGAWSEVFAESLGETREIEERAPFLAVPDLGLYQEVDDDLTLEVYDFGSSYQLNFKYQHASFGAATIQRWSENYLKLLEQFLQEPHATVESLEFLTAGEEQSLLRDFSSGGLGAESKPSEARTVIALIDATAARLPEQIALRFNQISCSYKDLVCRSQDSASKLARAGVRAGDVVGVQIKRSIEQLAYVLGILRLGAAYLPLDVKEPSGRLLSKMVTSRAVGLVRGSGVYEAMRLVGDRKSTKSDIAYVMFTSGSSGEPKGVRIRHESLINLCQAMIELYELTPQDRVLQFAPLSFDMSVEEIFPALVAGATVVLREEDDLQPERFEAMIEREKVTLVNLPPSYHSALLTLGEERCHRLFSNLRIVAFGGDSLPLETLRSVQQSKTRIFNVYGPTEATVNATAGDLTREEAVTIGRPLRGVGTFILDGRLRPVPLGVTGELCITGRGVAQGYLPGAEHSAFVPNPFGQGLMYRTGDAARWCEDGQIELLGRMDRQVSIRGHRVEPAEIEAALLSCEGVREAAVVARADGSKPQLVAFITAAGNVVLTRVRSDLRRLLPDYMLPAVIQVLDALPLTAQGKIDRQSLHSCLLNSDHSQPKVPLQTVTEFTVATIFASVLAIEEVGASDNFFDLGGHSLLAIQILAQLNAEFQVNLALTSFLGNPDVAAIAKDIDRLIAADHSQNERKRENSFAEFGARKSELRQSMDAAWVESIPKPSPSLGSAIATDRVAKLSPSQSRLWFLCEMGESQSYVIPGLARLVGQIDLNRLRSAFQRIVARHESLRTSFDANEGVPFQKIHQERSVPFQVHGALDREQGRELADRLAALPFDLRKDSLIRIDVIPIADSCDHGCGHECLLLVTMHHIISDGWSIRVLLNELVALYENPAAELPCILYPYSDYAAWQAAICNSTSPAFEKYSQRLLGYSDLQLPTDDRRPEILSDRGQTLCFCIPQELNDRIHRHSRTRRCSPLSLWIVGVYLLLRSRSGQQDFCLGIPVAGRSQPEFAPLIGFFVNTLILRLEPTQSTTSSGTEFLTQVQAQLLELLECQDYPVERLFERLRPPRRLDRTPVFQVLVNYAADPLPEFTLGECALSPLLPISERSKFEITFSINEMADGTALLAIEFATDLFRPSTLHGYAQQLQQFVTQLMEEPHRCLHEFDGLTATERQRLLQGHHVHQAPEPDNEIDIMQALREQVSETPDAPALISGEQCLTYRELDDAVDQVAKQLADWDIGSEHRVALCYHDNLKCIVAMLGVLKVRAAFVPFEPSTLTTPFDDLLSQCRASVLLSDDGEVRFVSHDPRGDSTPLSSQTLAYMMYTSGSTGKSKGVLVERGSVANHSTAVIAAYGLRPTDVMAQFSTCTFDIFIEEVFPTLRIGGRIVVLDREKRTDPKYLLAMIREHRITVLNLPTAMFHLLVDDGDFFAQVSDSLRLIIVGGERLDAALAQRLLLHNPNIALINTYGPTEATVVCAAHRVTDSDREDVPLGLPLAGCELLVLDAELRLAPLGAIGELFIGGRGLARGYWNRDSETKAKFIEHPWRSGERLFRSGDLVKRREDGRLLFVGRLDDQVKIRGHRIELSTIEHLLETYPEVQRAVVVCHGDTTNQRLIACIEGACIHDALDGLVETLQERLSAELPQACVPSQIIVCSKLPLTAGGKIDRQAVLNLVGAKRDRGVHARRSTTAALTSRGRELRGLWESLLDVKSIELDDHFFTLGGNSLLAVRLARQIEAMMDVEFPVVDVFRHPLFADMAHQIEQRCSRNCHRLRSGQLGDPLGAPRKTTVILPGLPGIAEHYYELEDWFRKEGDVICLSLPGYEGGAIARSIEEVSEAWCAAIAKRGIDGDVDFIAHSYSGTVLYEMLRSRNLPGSLKVGKIVFLDCTPHRATAENRDEQVAKWLRTESIQRTPQASEIVSAALRATYEQDIESVNQHLELVIAKSSVHWFDQQAWNSYFRSVSVRVVPGNHSSIAKHPDYENWIPFMERAENQLVEVQHVG